MNRTLQLALASGVVALAGFGFWSVNADAHRGGGGGHGGYHKGGHGGGHGMRGHRRGGKRGIRRMLRKMDTNEDGKVTQAEIDERLKGLLTKHDANSDGKLSLAEYQNLWLEVRRQRMVRGFQRLDKDGDAIVTTEELMKPWAKVVERMDRNEDGVIDKNDRRRRGGWRRGRGRGGDDDKKQERDDD